jgi:hypothetical protein
MANAGVAVDGSVSQKEACRLDMANCGPLIWLMEVMFDGEGQMNLNKGWEKFARVQSVELGTFVHFKYEGDDVLPGKVFKKSDESNMKPSI